jgi:DNA-directed RNA polymerase subunit RPC12/RpoP
MVNHTCMNCDRTFTAVSQEEAEDAYKSQVEQGQTDAASFKDAVDIGEVAYAKYCPYCGSPAIETS